MTDSSMVSPLVRRHIFYERLLGHAIPLDGKLIYGNVGLSRSSRSVPSDIVIIFGIVFYLIARSDFQITVLI